MFESTLNASNTRTDPGSGVSRHGSRGAAPAKCRTERGSGHSRVRSPSDKAGPSPAAPDPRVVGDGPAGMVRPGVVWGSFTPGRLAARGAASSSAAIGSTHRFSGTSDATHARRTTYGEQLGAGPSAATRPGPRADLGRAGGGPRGPGAHA